MPKQEKKKSVAEMKPEIIQPQEKDADLKMGDSLKIENKESDPIKERLLDFLQKEGVIEIKNGINIFNADRLRDEQFRKNLDSLYLGRVGKTIVRGSRRIIFEKFSDLKVVSKGDFLKNESKEKSGISLEDAVEGSDRKKIKEKILEILRKNDVLQTKEGINVFDLEKFFKGGVFNEKIKEKYLGKVGVRDVQGNYENVFGALADLKVVSVSDFEKNQKEGKKSEEIPLLNIPKNIDEAFDLQNIKNKKYYLNQWDLYASAERKQINWNSPIVAESGEEINKTELALATEIFRNFQGHRDQEGNLMVFDKEKGDFSKMNMDWVTRNIGTMRGVDGKIFSENAQRFLINNCPNILEKKLLDITDFRVISTGASGEMMRKEFYPQKNNPYLMLNGMRYFIGKEKFNFNGKKIPTENIKVVVLDPENAGIVEMQNGREVLRYKIKLINEEEKKNKREEVGKKFENKLTPRQVGSRVCLNKDEVDERTTEWKPTEDNPKKSKETAEDYAERIRKIIDFNYVSNVSEDFTRESGLGIHNLSWREQQWLAAAAFEQKGNYSELIEFGKKFGLDGLKTFLTCEFNLENSQNILLIGEKIEEKDAKKIFSKANELIKVAEEENGKIEELFSGEIPHGIKNIKQNLLIKAKEIVALFGEKLDVKKADKTEIKKLIDDLENFKLEIALLAAVLKSMKESGEKNFDSVKNIKTEKREIGERNSLSDEEKEEMMTVLEKNYRRIFLDKNNLEENYNPEAYQGMIEEFKNDLYSPGAINGQIFYMLKFQNKIIGFCRFEIKKGDPETVTLKSANVHEEVRGCSLGNPFLKYVLEETSGKFNIEGETRAKNPFNKKYKEMGFDFYNTFEEGGVKGYNMRINRKNNININSNEADFEFEELKKAA